MSEQQSETVKLPLMVRARQMRRNYLASQERKHSAELAAESESTSAASVRALQAAHDAVAAAEKADVVAQQRAADELAQSRAAMALAEAQAAAAAALEATYVDYTKKVSAIKNGVETGLAQTAESRKAELSRRDREIDRMMRERAQAEQGYDATTRRIASDGKQKLAAEKAALRERLAQADRVQTTGGQQLA